MWRLSKIRTYLSTEHSVLFYYSCSCLLYSRLPDINEMFLMRDTTLNNTVSNLRSVASKKF